MALAARSRAGRRVADTDLSRVQPGRKAARPADQTAPAARSSSTKTAARAVNGAKAGKTAQAANADHVSRPAGKRRPAAAAPDAAFAAGLGLPPAGFGLEAVASAFGQSVGQSLQSLAKLSLPFEEMGRIRDDYLQQATELWNLGVEAPQTVPLSDPRFAAADWQTNGWARVTAAFYLLNTRTLARMADALEGDEKSRQRVRFAVQQWAAASSPANFLALNPEAQRLAVETGGKSLESGLGHLLHDLKQGHMSQTDESVFEVGRNVATSEGSVVYENEFFQLIEYKPLTEKVHERPLLIVPPCINKFYILDLQPENSLVRYAVEQGMRTFIVSWVNPGDELAAKSWDDYVENGAIRAIREVQAITRQRQINALGFCIGGTLLGSALAVLKAQGEDAAASLTLLASFLDFSQTGVMDIFVDEAAVQMREATLGASSSGGGALMKGRDLAATFSFLRPTDLVWNYVVGNYLKGETPPPFDLLYWNSDSTNLPGPMYCWYLRHTYLNNELIEPGKVEVCGTPLDLSQLDMPAFIVATKEDHIVPWQSAYGSMKVLGGDRRFVLGASGHIAGIVNPPAKKKRSYWSADAGTGASHARKDKAAAAPASAQEWLAGATEHPGSWWTGWSDWLRTHAGKQIAAPRRAGDAAHPVLEAAPGRYVKVRV